MKSDLQTPSMKGNVNYRQLHIDSANNKDCFANCKKCDSDSDNDSDNNNNLEDSIDLPSTSQILIEQRRHIARLAKAVNEEVSDMMNDNVDSKISDNSLDVNENSDINDFAEHYVGDDGNTYHDEDEQSESISFVNTNSVQNKNCDKKNERQKHNVNVSVSVSDEVSNTINQRNEGIYNHFYSSNDSDDDDDDDEDEADSCLNDQFEEDDGSNDEYEYGDN